MVEPHGLASRKPAPHAIYVYNMGTQGGSYAIAKRLVAEPHGSA